MSDCSAYGNSVDGIQVNVNCEVLNNACANNTSNGIHAIALNNRIEGNNVVANGSGASGVGIRMDVTPGNIVIRNSARGNGTGATSNYVNVPATAITTITGNAPDNTLTAPWTNFSY